MEIQLDPNQKRKIEELARESGKAVEDLLRDLVGEALATRQVGENGEQVSTAIVARQQESLKQLREELKSLPVHNPADGLSGRDHDKIIYDEER